MYKRHLEKYIKSLIDKYRSITSSCHQLTIDDTVPGTSVLHQCVSLFQLDLLLEYFRLLGTALAQRKQ